MLFSDLSTKKNKILVVEDNDTMLNVLIHSLSEAGYDVATATNGTQAIEVARRENPALIVLDVLLPELDGFEVCRILRKDMTVPIIMITAKAEIEDMIRGLEVGADGYFPKPFSIRELMARMKALLRRSELAGNQGNHNTAPKQFTTLRIGELEMDFIRHQVTIRGHSIHLRLKEFELLSLLMTNHGKVLSREQILEAIWGDDFEGDSHTVDVHIRSLRKKIEANPSQPDYIITVWGVGYKLTG